MKMLEKAQGFSIYVTLVNLWCQLLGCNEILVISCSLLYCIDYILSVLLQNNGMGKEWAG